MDNCCLVRTSADDLKCFYINKEKGIAYKAYENARWSRETVLVPKSPGPFTVSHDKSGALYVFCQDKNGDILLVTNGSGSWATRTVLKNEAARTTPVTIHPIITSTGLSILYNMPSPETRAQYIVMQTLGENGRWSAASRVDKPAPVGGRAFGVQRVTNEHLLLFYQTKTPETNLGYREITPNARGAFRIFHTTGYTVSDMACLTTDSAIHVLYIVKGMFSSQLIYRKKEAEYFSNPILIAEAQSLTDCLPLFVKDNLNVFFLNNGQPYLAVSDDRGSTFKNPARYKNKFCLRPMKAAYISRPAQKESAFYCRELYVDSESPWDVQVLPELFEDFYPQPRPMPIPKPAASKEGAPMDAFRQAPQNESLLMLQNQFVAMQQQLQERDQEIFRLNMLLASQKGNACPLTAPKDVNPEPPVPEPPNQNAEEDKLDEYSEIS